MKIAVTFIQYVGLYHHCRNHSSNKSGMDRIGLSYAGYAGSALGIAA